MKINFLVLCVSLIIAFFLSEAGLKLYNNIKQTDKTIILSKNKNLIYEHKQSITFTNRHNINISYNSLGFIGGQIQVKQADTYRIFGVGDSITAGEYIPEGDRYLSRINDYISQRANKKIETINAGISGYNSWQELEVIRTKSLLVNPDLIIVGICMNDYVGRKPRIKSRPNYLLVDDFRDGSKAKYLNSLYQRSDLYKLVYDLIHNLKCKIYGQNKNIVFDYKPSNNDMWFAVFREMSLFSKEHNIQILFVLFPPRQSVINQDKYTYKPLTDFFKNNSLDYIDLIGKFTQSNRELYKSRDNLHPNKYGNLITASAIADHISKKLLL